MAGYTDAELERTSEDLGSILQFLEAALLTNDPRTFLAEFLPWLTRVLTAHGLPAEVVAIALEALEAVLGPYPHSRNLVAQGKHLTAQPGTQPLDPRHQSTGSGSARRTPTQRSV